MHIRQLNICKLRGYFSREHQAQVKQF